MRRPTIDQFAVGAVIIGAASFAYLSSGVIAPSMSQVVSDHLMTVLPAVAGIASLITAYRRRGHRRVAWMLLGAWGLLSASGNAIWTYYELIAKTDPFPSLADAGYLAGNICAALAIAAFAYSPRRLSKIRTALDAIVIGGSVFVASWAIALHTVYSGSSGSLVERAVGLAYPVLDVIIVTLIVFAVSRVGGRGRTSLRIINLGLIGWAFADLSFAYTTTIGTYRSGGPLDSGWIGGDALIALAAILALREKADEEPMDDVVPSWRLHLPYIAAGISLVAAGVARIATGRGDTLTLVAMMSVLLVVVGRQFVVVLEHQAFTIGRLRSLDDMKNAILRAVSHELRTPLTYIKGAASFLESDGDSIEPAVRSHMHQRLVANAERLEDLLAGLLDLERLTRGLIVAERRTTDVGAILTNIAEHAQDEGHRIHVRTGTLLANVDATGVERIVDNLVVNAVRHTPAGTNVRVGAERTDDGVVITVEDDGPGLPSDVKATAFEPFVQSELAGRGTGIGLSLVAKFTEIHDGRAWAEDVDGGGARFCVFLADPHDGSVAA